MINLTNCINCGAPLSPESQYCRYCGTYRFLNKKNPVNLVKKKKFRTRVLYPILFITGLSLFIYIYLFAFDSFSETRLVQITPLWFFPVVIGLYGYFSEFLLHMVVNERGRDVSEAYSIWLSEFMRKHIISGIILSLFFSPFRFLRFKNSLLTAFTGSLIWGVILIFFFNGIFPSL